MAAGGGGDAVSSPCRRRPGRANSAIFVKSNFLLKIGMQAIVALMKTPDRDLPSVEKSNEGQDLTGSGCLTSGRGAKKFSLLNAGNPLKSQDSEERILGKERKNKTQNKTQIQGKARNGKENLRKEGICKFAVAC
jgi:hypothetical protein